MKPLVTIAIPTLNRYTYLVQALESAKNQTYPNVEIIVSNNASTDETATVLQKISDSRVVILEQVATLAVFDHWDKCLETARGKYFLLLSDDDLLEPNAIEDMVRVFEEADQRGEELAFVGARTTVIDSSGAVKYFGSAVPEKETAENAILAFFRSEREIVPCATLFRTEDVRPGYARIAGDFFLAADAVLWMELITRDGQAGYVDRDLARYRVHTNTTTKTPLAKWYSENLHLAEFAIEAMRQNRRGDAVLYDQIRTAAKKLNVRITASFVASRWTRSRREAMGAAMEHAKQFANPYGIIVLLKTVIASTMPRRWRPGLITFLRKLRKPGLRLHTHLGTGERG